LALRVVGGRGRCRCPDARLPGCCRVPVVVTQFAVNVAMFLFLFQALPGGRPLPAPELGSRDGGAVSAEARLRCRRRKHHGRMVFETTYINFDPIPTWSGLFRVFGFGHYPSTSGVWQNPAMDPPTTRSGAGGARRVDVGAPDYSARAGNGIGSRGGGIAKAPK